MTSVRQFSLFDLLRFDRVNRDTMTETFRLTFYAKYLSTWPEYCKTAFDVNGEIAGYILGKAEGSGTDWHGHVSAVTVRHHSPARTSTPSMRPARNQFSSNADSPASQATPHTTRM